MATRDLISVDETSSSSSMSIQPSSSSTPPKPIITKTTSNKRKLMLTIDGFQFQMENFNKNKTLKFWRCVNRSCGVLLHTNLNDEFVHFAGKKIDHCYLPNSAELEIRNLKEAMR